MVASLALFAFFSVFVAAPTVHGDTSLSGVENALRVFVGDNAKQRNDVHFHLNGDWIGSPVGLFQAQGAMQVIYETAELAELRRGCSGESSGDGGSASDCAIDFKKTHFKWARASTTDRGMTWLLHGDFLDAVKLGLPKDSFLTRGGIIKLPKGTPDRHYVVAYGIRSTGPAVKPEIVTIFANDRLEIDVSKTGLKAEGVDPSLFEYNGVVYLAFLKDPSLCTVTITEVESNSGAESSVVVSGAPCQHPQLVQVDSETVAVVASTIFQDQVLSVYWLAGVQITEGKLELNLKQEDESAEAPVFDAGSHAQDFVFAKSDSDVISVGWINETFGSDSKSGALPRYKTDISLNSLTLLRKISLDADVLKQDPWIIQNTSPSKPATTSLPKDKWVNVRDLTEVVTQGAAFLTMNFKDKDGHLEKGTDELTTKIEICFGQGPKECETATGNSVSVTVETYGASFVASSGSPSVSLYGLTVPKSDGQKQSGSWFASIAGQARIVLDKSVMEVYGNDGSAVMTESYSLKDETPLSHVAMRAGTDLDVQMEIASARTTVKKALAIQENQTGVVRIKLTKVFLSMSLPVSA